MQYLFCFVKREARKVSRRSLTGSKIRAFSDEIQTHEMSLQHLGVWRVHTCRVRSLTLVCSNPVSSLFKVILYFQKREHYFKQSQKMDMYEQSIKVL